MEKIKVKDKYFKPYIPYSRIEEKIKILAAELNKDYKGKNPLFLSILNGSFIFAADLFKEIKFDCTISFVKIASYKGTSSSGNVISLIGLEENIRDRHVIVLEDIVDTGKTLSDLLPSLQNQNPASLKIASLLVKPEALKHDVPIDYFCFNIPNDFIVGYGLDYDGYGRNLRDIYQITG